MADGQPKNEMPSTTMSGGENIIKPVLTGLIVCSFKASTFTAVLNKIHQQSIVPFLDNYNS